MLELFFAWIVFLFLSGSSLYSYQKLRDWMDYRYEKEGTSLEHQLRLDGYYCDTLSSTLHSSKVKSIFFADGTALVGVNTRPWIGKRMPSNKEPSAGIVVEYHPELIWTDDSLLARTPNYIILKAYYWGIYKMRGDTIDAKLFHVIQNGAAYDHFFECKYHVIDSVTIRLISASHANLYHSLVQPDYARPKQVFTERPTDVLRFQPLQSPITPNHWMKRRKWFWRDKEDAKAFKQDVKSNNKKK